MNILIVDDSRINQMIAKDTLLKHQIACELYYADNGSEALDTIQKIEIDLMLLDIVMPVMTGIEVLFEMKQLNVPNLPEVIMLTSISDGETLLKCFELGAVDYIRKPFDDIDFVARIRSIIRTIYQKNHIKSDALKLSEQNKQLNEANKHLKEAQFYLIQKEKLAAIGELAAGVAHEINNPLAFVMSNFLNIQNYAKDLADFIKWLDEEKNKLFREEDLRTLENKWHHSDLDFILEDFPDLIHESHKGLERVAKIVTSMKNFSRISEENTIEAIDINALMEEVLLVVNNEIKYTAEIEKNYTKCPMISCNKGEIEQVFVNVLVNASQAIKECHSTEMGLISIGTAFDENYVMVSICDDGKGIDNETMSKVFDPFFTTKPVGQGTGLGLSISHSIIVEKHHGKIEVKSEVGVGTCFNIYLPR